MQLLSIERVSAIVTHSPPAGSLAKCRLASVALNLQQGELPMYKKRGRESEGRSKSRDATMETVRTFCGIQNSLPTGSQLVPKDTQVSQPLLQRKEHVRNRSRSYRAGAQLMQQTRTSGSTQRRCDYSQAFKNDCHFF